MGAICILGLAAHTGTAHAAATIKCPDKPYNAFNGGMHGDITKFTSSATRGQPNGCIAAYAIVLDLHMGNGISGKKKVESKGYVWRISSKNGCGGSPDCNAAIFTLRASRFTIRFREAY